MEQVHDEQKAFSYLMRVIQHGNAVYKARGYSDLAGLFDSVEVSFVKSNKDAVLFCLEKALTYTPDDTWILDYAASIYEGRHN
jgi:hypothetical protein